MTLSLNFNLSALFSQRSLRASDRSLTATIQRLSSGVRIARAADDPSGLVIANRMRHIAKGQEQATSNAEEGVSLLQTADGAMGTINASLLRLRSLAVQAANEGALDPAQLTALQSDFDNAVKGITQTATNTYFGSIPLLQGNLSDNLLSEDAEAHYTAMSHDATKLPAGIQDASTITIGAPTANLTHDRVQVSLSTTQPAVTIPPATTPVSGLFQNGGVDALTIAGSTPITISGPTGTQTITLTPANTIADFVSLVNNGTTTTGVRAAYDATTGALSVETTAFGTGVLNISGNDLTGVAAAGIGLLDTDTTSTQLNPLQSARDSYRMSFTNPLAPPLPGPLPGLAVATDPILGLNDAGTGALFDDVDGKRLTLFGGGGSASLTLTPTTTIQDVVDWVNASGASVGARAAFDPVTGSLDIVGSRGPLVVSSEAMSTATPNVGLMDLRTDLINSNGAAQVVAGAFSRLNATFTDANGQTRVVELVQDPTSEGGLTFTNVTPGPELVPPYSGWEPGALQVTLKDLTAGAYNGTLVVPVADHTATRESTFVLQIGAFAGQDRTVEVRDMRAGALGFTAFRPEAASAAATKPLVAKGYHSLQDLVDLGALANGDADEAIRVIDAAISEVSDNRGQVGALQANGIETAIDALRTSNLNLTDAESLIRDTDFAKESASFARLQIMVQAATAMLAQANQVPQSVLQLLQRQ